MSKRVCAALAAIFLSMGVVYAQQAPAAKSVDISVIPEWLYGEVVSVDIAGRSLLVRYLDYNTDIEKQDTVYVDDKTLFEGVKSLQDLKAQDTVSVDYVTATDGKFLAVAVALETFEEGAEPSLDELTAEPEKVGPPAAP